MKLRRLTTRAPGFAAELSALTRYEAVQDPALRQAVLEILAALRLRGDAALLGAAQALETAFEANPSLRRPRPDLERLRAARPELKSIVTHPPVEDGREAGQGSATAV